MKIFPFLFLCLALVLPSYAHVDSATVQDTVSKAIDPLVITTIEKQRTSEIRYGQPFFANINTQQINKPGQVLKKEDILLVINDRPFPEYMVKQVLIDGDTVRLLFNIDQNSGEGTNLAKYLGSKRNRVNELWLDIGKKDGTKVTPSSAQASIAFYTKNQEWVLFIVTIILLGIFLILANKSNLLKDRINDSTGNAIGYRWSLAKTQLAIWTLTISTLYILIWIINTGVPDINTTVLALLGISFGTAALAGTQPSGKELNLINLRMESRKSNFLLDLIDDGNGASIHRFQNLVFLVIFVCIFIGSTYVNLEFPNFDATQLLLLGISAAGYVGIKFVRES